MITQDQSTSIINAEISAPLLKTQNKRFFEIVCIEDTDSMSLDDLMYFSNAHVSLSKNMNDVLNYPTDSSATHHHCEEIRDFGYHRQSDILLRGRYLCRQELSRRYFCHERSHELLIS